MLNANITELLYLVSGVLFILALRGLSSPETSRRGNYMGIAGMAIAILTTLAVAMPSWTVFGFIVLAMVVGGSVGVFIAQRIAMTAMPQLVAAFHSLVGLAAMFVGLAAFYAPEAFGIGTPGAIHGESLIEMSLGSAIGAVTFTGAVIAFLKLDGRMSGAPIILPQRHVINGGLGILLVLLIVWFFFDQNQVALWLIDIVSLALGVLMIIPIGGADMPVVISMLNSYSGWAAAGIGFTLGNSALIITGALVGSSLPRSARPTTPPSSSRTRPRSSSCPATAWRWRRRNTRCARWPTSSRRRASRSNTPSTRSPDACPAT
jgi:NAD(P) transhydrogenase subunit beta